MLDTLLSQELLQDIVSAIIISIIIIWFEDLNQLTILYIVVNNTQISVQFQPRATARLAPGISANQETGNSGPGPVLDQDKGWTNLESKLNIQLIQLPMYNGKIRVQHELSNTDSSSRTNQNGHTQNDLGKHYGKPRGYIGRSK